jgi:hypothetical protein
VGLELQARIGRLLLDDGREAPSSVPSPAARQMILNNAFEFSRGVAESRRNRLFLDISLMFSDHQLGDCP